MIKTERIGIRITKELKKKLEILAKKEHRSFSNYVELVLINHVENSEAGHRA
jgi:predicted DNA-binding protein